MLNLKIVCLKIAIFLFSVPFFAEDWIIAGEKFELKQSKYASESLVKAAEVLPQLILEQLAVNQSRIVLENEAFDRHQNKLLKERLDLFLQLSKEIKVRDSLMFSEIKPKKLEKAIVKQEKVIKDIQEKIEENLAETDKQILEFENKRKGIEPDSKHILFKLFSKKEKEEKIEEKVGIYNNDITALFEPSKEAKELGHKSYIYSNELFEKKINCLLTGSISFYGDYVGVSTEVFVYPGAKKVSGFTEVGMISDLVPLAKRISQKISPGMMNAMPVNIEFDIASSIDENPIENIVVTIDEIVYTNLKKSITLDSGIHTITIEAAGFETETITYSFLDEKKFLVKARLNPLKDDAIKLRLEKFQDGIFFSNAIDIAPVEAGIWYSNIKINGKDVLAFFESDLTKEGAFVMVPSDIIEKDKIYSVNAKPFNRSKYIDRSRRRMYLAYSILMCSLPFTFYSLGEFHTANEKYRKKYISYDEVKKIQVQSNISQVVSIVAAGWFCIELIHYLYSANSVLPEKAKIDKHSEKYKAFRLDEELLLKMNYDSEVEDVQSNEIQLEDAPKKIENIEEKENNKME